MYRDLFPAGDPSAFAQHVFKNFDRDENGCIDFREFMTAVSVAQEGSTAEKLKRLFDLFDLDNTGVIRRQELIEMFTSIASLRYPKRAESSAVSVVEVVDYLLRKADLDGDGSLTEPEFIYLAEECKDMQKLLLGVEFAMHIPLDEIDISTGSFLDD